MKLHTSNFRIELSLRSLQVLAASRHAMVESANTPKGAHSPRHSIFPSHYRKFIFPNFCGNFCQRRAKRPWDEAFAAKAAGGPQDQPEPTGDGNSADFVFSGSVFAALPDIHSKW